MSAEQVAAAVNRLAATDRDPVLSEDEVAAIVAAAKRMDADGREIIDEDWVETYDPRAAVAEAWEVKAGKAAGRADLARGGSSIKRGSVHEACLRMARIYRRGVSSPVISSAPARRVSDLPLANGPDDVELGLYGSAGGGPQPVGDW